jgi:hypothetical protein
MFMIMQSVDAQEFEEKPTRVLIGEADDDIDLYE